LFTNASILPKRFRVSSMRARTFTGRETSASIQRERPPDRRIDVSTASAAASSARAFSTSSGEPPAVRGRRLATTTVARSAAKRREISLPRFRMPPVTTTTLPAIEPEDSRGSSGICAMLFCSSGRRAAPETRFLLDEPEDRPRGLRRVRVLVPPVRPAGEDQPDVDVAHVRGRRAFGLRLAHQGAFHGFGGHRGAQHRLEHLDEMPFSNGGNARQVRPHEDDGTVGPVPVHPSLRLPAEEAGDESEPVHVRAPFLEGKVGERALPVDVAGEMEEQVDAGEPVEELLHLRGPGEVHGGNGRHPLAPRGVDLEGELLELLGRGAGENDVRPGAGKRLCARFDQRGIASGETVEGDQCDLPHKVRVSDEIGGGREDARRLLIGHASHGEPLPPDRAAEQQVLDFERHPGEIPGQYELVPDRPVERVPLQRLGGHLPADPRARLGSFVEDPRPPLDAFGRDRRRIQRQDGDVAVGERPSQVVAEGQLGGLGGGVGEPARIGVKNVSVDALAVEGPHHDDHPSARLRLHQPRGLEAGEPGPREVDVHRIPVQVEMLFPVGRAEFHGAGDPGVVVEDVDPSSSRSIRSNISPTYLGSLTSPWTIRVWLVSRGTGSGRPCPPGSPPGVASGR
jgi:hypothetical protein